MLHFVIIKKYIHYSQQNKIQEFFIAKNIFLSQAGHNMYRKKRYTVCFIA